jgi:16S rRNA C967 or C1407 C5-methylase (RsmB/RsmF family)
MGGMALPVDENAIAEKVMASLTERFQQANEAKAQEELQREATRIADEYKSKMASGKEVYEDFEDVMADFNPQAFPNLVYLANTLDNTREVMYEIIKNPSKWATVAVLSERDPNAAKTMLNRISASIKANEQAKAAEREVQPPLNRLSSSTAGQDSGKLTLQDMKRRFRG